MTTGFPFLQPIARRPWILILTLFLAVAGGSCYVLLAIPQYQSNAQILVIQKDTRLTSDSNDAGLESSIQSEILGTHLQILSSPKIIRNAIEKHDLLKLESLLKEARRPKGLAGKLPMINGADNGPPDQEDLIPAVDYIRSNMDVRRGGADAARDAQVVSVSFRHYSSKDDCAQILKAVVASYRDFLQSIASRLGEETKTAMIAASANMEDTVQRDEAERHQFLLDSPLIWNNGVAANPHRDQAASLEAELSDLKVERASIVSRLTNVETTLKEGADSPLALFALVDEADIQRLTLLLDVERGRLPASAAEEFGKLVDLKVELERKEAIYDASHPQVRQLRKTVSELEKFLVAKHAVPAIIAG